MYSLLSFIFVLGVLIFVHELGHFLLAKACGVRVLKFSLGFGNKVVGRQWGDTEYLISAGVPRSSFVSVTGAGESHPVADNKTAEGRALNRRTEIQINR